MNDWYGKATAPLLVWLLAFGSLGGPLFVLSGYDLAALFVDDAFYYFQIARNLAAGLGPTFDGLHATNGFHPLWLLLLLPVFAVLPGLDAAVRAAGLLEAALVAWGAVLIFRGLRARGPAREALLAALLAFALPGTRGVLRTGLEGALVFVLLALAWQAWLSWKDAAPHAVLKLGVCLALLALARLECVALTLALVFLERRTDRRALAVLVLPTAIALAVYVSYNLVQFGIPVPVSGMVKRAAYARRGMWQQLGTLAKLLLSAAALAALAFVIRSRAPELAARLWRNGAVWLLLGAAGVFSADMLSLGGLQKWYWVPALPALAIALATAARRWPLPTHIAIALLALAALARVPHTLWVVRHNRLHGHIRGDAADALRALVPEDALIGAWNGGMLGYYSQRHVIMLDGLANDVAFYRRVSLGRELERYLTDEHIKMLVLPGCKLTRVPLQAAPGTAQRIEQRVVKRRALARDPQADPCFAYSLWEL